MEVKPIDQKEMDELLLQVVKAVREDPRMKGKSNNIFIAAIAMSLARIVEKKYIRIINDGEIFEIGIDREIARDKNETKEENKNDSSNN